jgi:hypothetical protein
LLAGILNYMIKQYYRGKSLFITGVTGFVGRFFQKR